MTNTDQIDFRTVTPVHIPISLKTGTDQASAEYQALMARVTAILDPSGNGGSTGPTAQADYEVIERDTRDIRLFTWQADADGATLRLHVFPNSVGIAEAHFSLPFSTDAAALAKTAQEKARAVIKSAYPAFLAELRTVAAASAQSCLRFEDLQDHEPKIYWTSRFIHADDDALRRKDWQELVSKWLEHTYRPSDAGELIAGKRAFSMTWLNYVVRHAADLPACTDSMVLAQYYYTAQDSCNAQLKEAIDVAYNGGRVSDAEKKLAHSRVTTRLHQIDYHEHLKYLSRRKREMVEDILECWNFDDIVKNGQRMIEVCSARLEEAENRRRERSSVLTDLLLVTLSFFAVFELSLYLTEFSREMMSRPALDYNDENTSIFLRFIAEIDADVMFSLGFGLTLVLVLLYRHAKRR
ncbi:hypothetical protein [Kordiimonas gwangyangensis]|uniref:hypothetical protein n=2 Tax=Kordiimonas gwangyangensis TaxID=288022 RepID=UPI0003757BF6|nr:hypothetical protein [Kordiimonas gwangyangensis]